MFLPDRRRLAVAMCCVVMLLAVTSPPSRAAATIERAMWVWGEADRQLPIWARTQGIDTLLLEIPTTRLRDASTREVIRSARRRGVRVWALSGRPAWATDPGAASRWTRAVARTPGLSGIVLDVEPYLLENWTANRSRTIKTYLRMLQKVKAAAGRLPVMAAVPFWFDHDAQRTPAGTLAAQVAARVDALVVMAYRDQVAGADGVVALARGEIDIVGRMDKMALVALQTADDSLDKLTFYEEGGAALDAAITEIERTFAYERGFGGIALHHYHDTHHKLPSGWVSDLPEGEPGWGWAALILPYMEQGNLHDVVDFERHIDDEQNQQARTFRVPIYFCPSDGAQGVGTFLLRDDPMREDPHQHDHLPIRIACSNYVGLHGCLSIESPG